MNQSIAKRNNEGQQMQVVRPSFASTKMSLADLKELAAVYIESGQFPDLKNVAQAVIKIKAGEDLGFSPHVSIAGIHFFQGRAVIGANLLASLIKDSGKYEYKVLQHDAKVCSIQMMQLWAGEWRNMGVPVTYTFQDATNAGLTSKDVWKKFPADMLFAAVIRQACRRYCADVLRGTPTLDHYADEEASIDETAITEQRSAPEQSDNVVDSEVVIDGEPVQIDEHGEVIEPSSPDPELDAIREDLIAGVGELLESKFGTDKIEKAKFLKSRNPAKMTADELSEMHADLLAL